MTERPIHRSAVACGAAELAIEDLAFERVLLLEQLALETGLRESYRVLAQQGCHRIYELSRQMDRMRAERTQLIEENRRLRATLRGEEAA